MFLATKLFLPPPPTGAVTRERLYALLDEGWSAQVRMMLLSTPPGYGKTTLLSGWAQARNVTCAWVSLDAEDNDPARFFLLLLRALEPHFPTLADLLPILNVPQVTHLDTLMVEVVNHIAQSSQPVLLVLDDYHAITSQNIHDLIQRLLDHLPPQLRLAVLTREDPPFALARMRARRQMLELRARELTFSDSEGYQLLVETLNIPLSAAQVTTLLDRTEGWAAGLQLAALTLRGRSQPEALVESFSGSHRFVLDYLAAEVLEQLSPDLRSFLYRSAILDRFTAALCDAALERTDSREMIAHAAAANLFLIPLDEERAWYRYHHLMADILKAEITISERQAICARAARWWQQNNQPIEAVRYALQAQDYDLACDVIQQAALPAAESGLLSTALGWLDALPLENLLAHHDLCVIRAWFLLFNGRFREAAAWLEQVAAQMAGMPRPLAGLLTGMQAWMRSIAAQKLDVARLQEAYAMAEGKYAYFLPMMLLAIGQAQREAEDLAGALRSFEEGASMAEVTSGPVSALIIRNNQAFLLNETGARQSARQLCLDGIEQFTSPDGKPGLLAGIPMIPYGCFLFETGKLDEAYATLTQAVNIVRRIGMYDILCGPANYTLQLVLADQGRLEESLALNKEVRRQAVKTGLQVVVNEADVIAAWAHMIAGDPGPAEHWGNTHPLNELIGKQPPLSAALLLHARLLSRHGKGQQAVALLLPQVDHARAAGLVNTWLRGSAELVLCYLAAGEQRKAGELLTQAVETAERTEFFQVFRRNAAALAPLLDPLRPRFPHFVQAVCATAPPAAATSTHLVEALTDREAEILRLVAAGLSNNDIASRLYLTTGTVKWYLNQLFGKLGVNRRTEAVAKAREISLL